MPVTPSHTVDAFHRGRFFLVQPLKGAHRAGMDSLALAAATPSGFKGRAADFGAGAGAVGLAVLSRCAEASALLVENSPEMAEYARLTLAHESNQAFSARAEVLVADINLTGKKRVESGLENRSVDFVLMNPPFNDARDRATPDALRRQAHVADDDLFENWLRSAAAVLRPGGTVALIARPASLATVLHATERRFGGIQLMPIHPACDQPAIRFVIRATLGSRAGLSLLPPLILREDGKPSDRADAVVNGQASLFGD